MKSLFIMSAFAAALAGAAPAMAEAVRTRELVRSGDVQIDVIAEGRGPVVVMLPSRGRDSEDYDEVAEKIAAAGFRVLRPQPRGIGASRGPMQGVTLHDFARDIAALIEAARNVELMWLIGRLALGRTEDRRRAASHLS